MFKEMLAKCIEGHVLTQQEAKQMMDEVMQGRATPSQIASLLTLLRFRGETAEEMAGFIESMRAHARTIPHNIEGVIDTCGTGGDCLNTYNISTASAIALSAIGVKVAKHGNRGVSSKSGSADALEALGIPVQQTPEEAAIALETTGLAFLFAPLYHVAMKHAVTPRQELGFRTVFNMLGPLTNPANADGQLIGVYSKEAADKMAEAYLNLGGKRAVFVHGADGLDELTIAAETYIVEVANGKIRHYTITPEAVGLSRGELAAIQVRDSKESATIIEQVLGNRAKEEAKNILLLNAGAGLYVANQVETIAEGVHRVRKALEDGTVYDYFSRLAVLRKEKRHA